ncbi:hypothetical protein V495_08196, partial [Pseudogymnoascus sp. VKM F-4514 (FW-929)]
AHPYNPYSIHTILLVAFTPLFRLLQHASKWPSTYPMKIIDT